MLHKSLHPLVWLFGIISRPSKAATIKKQYLTCAASRAFNPRVRSVMVQPGPVCTVSNISRDSVVVCTEQIEYTDFPPEGIQLFVANNTILLLREC
jgi:hypothetical protein